MRLGLLLLCPTQSRIYPPMGRALRLHQPGSAFHIVSRTQGHERWVDDAVKTHIADLLLQGVVTSGAKPIAFAIMDTHFHLILLQGSAPLGWTMQTILRRIALLVQKRHGVEGHVFERRFRAKLCQDSEHLPNAILYVHRNPVVAGICQFPRDYNWSSAAAYEGKRTPGWVAVEDGLRAFVGEQTSAVDDARTSYNSRLQRTSQADLDSYWNWFWRETKRRRRTRDEYVPTSPHEKRAQLRDIRDAALTILRTIDSQVDAQVVRSRYGGPHIVGVRQQLIAALVQRGYSGVSIAKYMRISQTAVSRVRSAIRWSSIRHGD